MPYGRFNPVTNVSVVTGFPSAVMPRNTFRSPPELSAMKISPLGAVKILRGSLKPLANNSTLKPGGATGQAFFGRSISLGPLVADLVAIGLGMSLGRILCVTPGF